MGGFYGSVQLRCEDRAKVLAAAEAVAAEMKIKCLVGPALNGWVGVYPEGSGQDHAVGEKVAARVGGYALHVLVHDDDVLAYWLWSDGTLVDRYWSAPGVLDETARTEEEPLVGDANKFRPLIGEKADQLSNILDRRNEFTFEGERLALVAKKLGITNAMTSLEYLEEGGRHGIKGWRKFDSVSPRPVKSKAELAAARRPTAKTLRQRLFKSGELLYSDEHKGTFEIGMGRPLGDGFVLGWLDMLRRSTQPLMFHSPPWSSPQPSPIQFPTEGGWLRSDTTGGAAVIISGKAVWIFVDGQLRQAVADVENLRNAVISPDRTTLVYAAGQEIVVLDLATSQRLYAVSFRNPSILAFHPSGQWVVASGDLLRLIHFGEHRDAKDIYVGGTNTPVTIGNVRGIEEPGCIGFSKDGRLFWCGTNVGIRIFRWDAMTSPLSGCRPKTAWRIVMRDKLESFWDKQVTAIAEEPDGTGIVFGTIRGNLGRLDFKTLECQKLLAMPGGGKVNNLLMARDGSVIVVYSDFKPKGRSRGMPKHTRSWEIFDYTKLRSKAVPIPVERATPPAVEDINAYRRVRLRRPTGGKPR